jgi:hypothetical protein
VTVVVALPCLMKARSPRRADMMIATMVTANVDDWSDWAAPGRAAGASGDEVNSSADAYPAGGVSRSLADAGAIAALEFLERSREVASERVVDDGGAQTSPSEREETAAPDSGSPG